jgi:hypothetical protein
MASSEYHCKQAEILAGLALAALDEAKAAQLSLLALQHRAMVSKREPGRLLPQPPPPRSDDNRELA